MGGCDPSPNPKGYERARALRKELTPAERKLRVYLRGDNWNNQVENDPHASLAGIVRAVEVAIKN
jgi:hypothetical protein